MRILVTGCSPLGLHKRHKKITCDAGKRGFAEKLILQEAK